ncbi:hypothetical protein FQN57_002483 [Myotisia sp. PD_48]|nr:hypothetical protein FQN57_002483 [Myotisia sp. PD_48]
MDSAPESLSSISSTDSFTVGCICTTLEEYECAYRMLTEHFKGPELAEGYFDNTYTYGRIGEHHIVVGCRPGHRYTPNPAAHVAQDMIQTFPKLRFVLMVGVGGGAPTIDNDIRLGDLQNGYFPKISQLNGPPEQLLEAIAEMQRLHNHRWKLDAAVELLRIAGPDGSYRQLMDNYERPILDQLYRPGYPHIGGIDCGKYES